MVLIHKKFNEAGIHPDDINSFADFSRKVPVTTKAELRSMQAEGYPLGSNMTVSRTEIVWITASTGTTGKPTYTCCTKKDWEMWMECAKRMFWLGGLRPEDTHIHALGLSNWISGISFATAAREIGATVIPVGVPTPVDRMLMLIRDLKPTSIVCTPSYAEHLANKCQELLDLKPSELGLRKFFCGGEPGASIPSFRRKMENIWQCDMRDLMGSPEMICGDLIECRLKNGFQIVNREFCYLAGAFDQNLDGKVGTTFPGFFALCFNAYMQKFGVSEKYIHQIAVKSRENAVKNPVCYLRKPTTVDDIMLSYPVAEPLHMADCCPISDGAAAVVLCPVEMAKDYHRKPVKILSVTQTLGTTRISDMPDMIRFDATIRAAQKAYKQAGINAEDVDVAELHDCFTIAEVIDSEDLGFFKKGEGALAAADGETKITGRIPINPSGGLLSRGHPVGATGLAQVYEIVKQLRGEAVNQVPNPEIGLTHNFGGPAAVCTVSILQKI